MYTGTAKIINASVTYKYQEENVGILEFSCRIVYRSVLFIYYIM